MILEILTKCGIESDKANEIVKAMNEEKVYTTSLENADVRYNKLQEQKKQYEEASKVLEKELKSVQKSNGDVEALNKTIEQLQLSNKELEANHKRDTEKLQFDFALDKSLSSVKAKDNGLVRALLKLDDITINEGVIQGLEGQIEAIKSTHGYLFEDEITNGGGFNPAGTNKGITKEQFNSMSYTDRMNLFVSDKETYNSLVSE